MTASNETDPIATDKRTAASRWSIRIMRILLGFVALLVILLTLGLAYQSIAQARDRRDHPPLGELIGVNGLQLHIYCKGEGAPVVVFESGFGSDSLLWGEVQDDIAQTTQACVYDRAGTGWSQADDVPPTSSRIASNLKGILEAAGIEGPYVLVGHSAGGLHIREFAQLYAEDVAGMILVDSSHENQQHWLPEELLELTRGQLSTLRLCRATAPFGAVRLLGIAEAEFRAASVSEDIRQAMVARFSQTHSCGTLLDEFAAYELASSQDAPPRTLGDLPLIVLTAGETNEGIRDAFPPETLEQLDALWLEAQSELASLSTNSQHRIVEGAAHNIHLDQPSAVAQAVKDILAIISE